MSDKPEIELDLDLQLLPAWARQPQATNRYANFEGGGDRDRRGPQGRGRGDSMGPRRDFRGDRRAGGGSRPPGGPGRGPRDDARGGRGRGGPSRHDGPRPQPMEEMPEGILVDLIPEPNGVDSLTRQIRQTGRAYPLFDIGHLILKRPDRYVLEFRATGNLADGTPRQLYVCNLDDSVWMSESEAVRHILAHHFDTFYQTEKIAVDPPKGTYTLVAQCGMSGVVLGPPNLHEYQIKLQRLHSERFSRLPFDVYKSRVKMVRDEAVVKQWIEEQSFKYEYNCLNLPEPLKLPTREAVEKHFREVHLSNILRPVNRHTVRTPAAREALPPPLRRLARREFELQQRFPLKLVTRLSDDFAHRGLHFFKVNKTVLHVSVARPRFLDLEATPVGDGIRKIMQAVEATPDCTRRRLLETLGVPLPPTPEPGAEPPAVEEPPSPELQAIVTDLHWLIHEGHVIEFANGHLEAAKRPAPRPQPVPRAPKTAPAAGDGAPQGQAPKSETQATPEGAPSEPPAAPAAHATQVPVDLGADAGTEPHPQPSPELASGEAPAAVSPEASAPGPQGVAAHAPEPAEPAEPPPALVAAEGSTPEVAPAEQTSAEPTGSTSEENRFNPS